ncbi:MAG: hypothetical protein LBT03_02765 [Holosporales bacterium]|jgi:hypothetical protein|nr:hypothetical protein [Holosporales bacterium]
MKKLGNIWTRFLLVGLSIGGYQANANVDTNIGTRPGDQVVGNIRQLILVAVMGRQANANIAPGPEEQYVANNGWRILDTIVTVDRAHARVMSAERAAEAWRDYYMDGEVRWNIVDRLDELEPSVWHWYNGTSGYDHTRFKEFLEDEEFAASLDVSNALGPFWRVARARGLDMPKVRRLVEQVNEYVIHG